MGNHWYDQTGKPCYTVIGKNGKTRDTTLADAKRLGFVPSVTTILEVISKPNLSDWKVKQGIMSALALPMEDGERMEEFVNRIVNDSRKSAILASEEGSRIHDAIEMSFKNKAYPDTYAPHVDKVHELLKAAFPDIGDWVAEASFACDLGYGGKVDLHSPSTGIVVDFKTKDLAPGEKKKLAYDQNYQLAAYSLGLGLVPNVCANIFVSRTHPGHAEMHVWNRDEVLSGWRVFSSALACWQAIKGYVPDFNGVTA
jgi:hypothetical protein